MRAALSIERKEIGDRASRRAILLAQTIYNSGMLTERNDSAYMFFNPDRRFFYYFPLVGGCIQI